MFAAPIIIILQVVAGPAVPEDAFEAHAKVETLEASPAPSVTRPLAAGAIIAAGDIRFADTGDQAAVTLIGKQTRRYLPLGAVLRASDIREPTLVARNSVVKITFERGPLTIAATGRAMSDGALGETIRVMNMTSKAPIAAIVVESGVVKVP